MFCFFQFSAKYRHIIFQTETVDLQMVIVTDDIETYVMYIYGDMQWGISPQVSWPYIIYIVWEQQHNAGMHLGLTLFALKTYRSWRTSSLIGAFILILQVGFDAGDGINYYSIEGSRTNAMLDIETTSNINIIGKYMFSASSVNITAPGKYIWRKFCYW